MSERVEQLRRQAAALRAITHPVCRALDEGNYAGVRAFCLEMFDHELSESDAKVIFSRWKGRPRPSLKWDTACGHAIWIKNRLLELRSLAAPHSPPTDFDELATAVLHVFFVSLEETSEMIAILHNEDLDASAKKLATARSKMFSTPLAVEPIDATSAKVASVHQKKIRKPNPASNQGE